MRLPECKLPVIRPAQPPLIRNSNYTIGALYHTMLCPQNDMFDLVLDLHTDPGKFLSMKPGEWYGSWELVWNEAHAVCSGDPPYHPCKEFSHHPLV